MEFMRITSAANPSIKLAKNLAQHPRAARKEGLSLAEGIHLARELLLHSELVRKVFLREGAEKNFEISEILQRYLSLKIPVVQLSSQIYSSISPVDTSAGIICEIRIPEDGNIKKDEDWIYLDGVQDPGNVGTILRSALASGVTNIALSQQCAYVWSPKVLRSAMGAHFFCNIISSVELEEIKEKTGAACLVADARGGKDLYEEKWGKDHTLWVFGSEGLGVSEKALELSDLTLLIPLDSRVESLNVATAASVCLFEQRRRPVGLPYRKIICGRVGRISKINSFSHHIPMCGSMLILSSSRIVAEISSMDLEVEERYLMPSRSIIRWASSTSYSQFSIEAYLELGRRSPRISERRLGEMDRPKILSLQFSRAGGSSPRSKSSGISG